MEAKAAAEAEAEAKAQQQAAAASNQSTSKYVFDSVRNEWIPPQFSNSSAVVDMGNKVSIQERIDKLNLTDLNLSHLKQAVSMFNLGPAPLPPPPPPPSSSSTQPHPVLPPSLTHTTNVSSSSLLKADTPLSPPSLVSSHDKTFASNDSSSKKRVSSQKIEAISARLPPGWKCKRNKSGVLYYFNEVTKSSQWNFPKVEAKKETETMSMIVPSSSPTKSESSNTSASMVDAPSGTSSNVAGAGSGVDTEAGKILKDQFREKVSRLVVKLLQPYMSPGCCAGRIENVADFKHLARKFTHIIMEKEANRVGNPEQLDLDNRIKVGKREVVWLFKIKII